MSEMTTVPTALLLEIAGYLNLIAKGYAPSASEAAEFVDKIGEVISRRADPAGGTPA